jgi:hypothetical protein
MTRYVDLPVEGTSVGRCVVLPGTRYTPDGPVLFFAAQVALGRGWEVRQVWWDVPELGLDAAWLTPLLTEADLAGPLLSYPARQYVAIGAEDPYLDRDVLDALPGEHLVVPGDHVLRVPGDPAAMVAGHERFVRSFDAWLATFPS